MKLPKVGDVVVLPVFAADRGVGEEDRHLLVLSATGDEVEVLVLGGRILGKTVGQVITLHGLVSLLHQL